MATDQQVTPPPAEKSVAENVRETLESIVVAFILAFVFRAFIVEAFVIPTGSMAPTLYGEHVKAVCSTCGYQYAIGIPDPPPDRMRVGPFTLRCPNCDAMTDRVASEAVRQPDSGDRILVQKWAFDAGTEWLAPQRWDVTVFKDPRDGVTNFIKRMVGLPGEVIQIIDGDVYTAPLNVLQDKAPQILEAMQNLRVEVFRLRNEPRSDEREIIRRYRELSRQLLPFMTIQRKSVAPVAQESLWYNIYNHDYLPNYDSLADSQNAVRVGWNPTTPAAKAAWNVSQRELSFRSESAEPLAIRFEGKHISDFYGYNNDASPEGNIGPRFPVGDVRLRFTWFPDSGTGSISLRLNRDQDTFIATLRPDGHLQVEGLHPTNPNIPGGRQIIGEKRLEEPFAPGQAVDVRFMTLDYQVLLQVNGETVIASTPQQYGPQLKKLEQLIEAAVTQEPLVRLVKSTEVEIAAANIACRFRHVVLEHDVYYRSQTQVEEGAPLMGGRMILHNPYYQWPGWGTSGMPLLLRSDPPEYFMLGDNSPQSKDSRLWWEIGPHLRYLGAEYQAGTVPGDQLIGKAFFVYWPAGYRLPGAGIRLIPNVGDMRWIR